MTFKTFETIFLSKYPKGEVIAHGGLAGTEGTLKTSVVFRNGGKCYSYYGSYADVLCKVGIKTINKNKVTAMENQLARLKAENGKIDDVFVFENDDEPFVIDWSREIEDLENRLNDIISNYIVI